MEIALLEKFLNGGGDNTGSGKECVWMSVKDLRAKYYDILPEETYFMAYATWFGSKGTGKCSFELVGYKGGTMSQDGYNFINTGGSVVYQNTYDFVCHTSKGSSTYKTSYENVARVTYNKLTNEVYMSIGDAIDQEDNYDKLEREINNIKERLSDVESELAVVRRIAEGKNTAYIFDTVDAMNEWLAVPDGVYEVEFALVAGGLNGEYSDVYNAGSGGNGGGVLTGTISVNPGVTYRVVVGDIGGDSIFGIYQAIAGKGGRGGYGVEGDGHDPSPGNPGQDGSYVFNNKYPDRYPYPMGAGGGSGAYTRGWDMGFLSGGKGGNHGGGDGAGVEDIEGVTINGKNGGNATYYGGGGGGASKASNSGATSGRGGSGYRGIVILHYFKN